MTHITSYDSFEEMQEALARADDAAFEAITPTQAAMERGTAWMRPHEEGIVIFGKSWTEQDHRSALDDIDVDDDEGPSIEDEVRHYDQQWDRGYMFGNAWSPLCPEGELGLTHKSVAWPITDEQLEQAREADWDFRVLPWFQEALFSMIMEVHS